VHFGDQRGLTVSESSRVIGIIALSGKASYRHEYNHACQQALKKLVTLCVYFARFTLEVIYKCFLFYLNT
jgi:hypothetical protein